MIFYFSFLLFILLLIAIFYTNLKKEGFASKREKAHAIVSWFNNNNEHTYTEFKKIRGSNLIEYDFAKKLFGEGRLNYDNLLDFIY